MRSSRAERALALLATVALSIVLGGRASAQACHEGRVEEDGIRWRSVVLSAGAFTAPLADDVVVESIAGGVARREGGRLVGVDLAGGARGPIVIRSRQSIGERGVTLQPPLVSGPQRIVLASDDGGAVSFSPDIAGPIARHVGHQASIGMDDGTRAALDTWCGPRGRGVPTYVRDVTYGDLRGELVRASQRRGSLLWVAWCLVAIGGVAGVIAYRRLAARAAIERADAVIEERFRALSEARGPRGP